MLLAFRRHVAGCAKFGLRTGQKCPRKPPCPIHVQGVDGRGKQIKRQALIDPRTGQGIRDWARACEVLRDMEAPERELKPEVRVTINEAVEHFLKLKKSKAPDTYRKNDRVVAQLKKFMASRGHQFVKEVTFSDLTDMCSAWMCAADEDPRSWDPDFVFQILQPSGFHAEERRCRTVQGDELERYERSARSFHCR